MATLKPWVKLESVSRDDRGRLVFRFSSRWWHPSYWLFAAEFMTEWLGQPLWSPEVWFWAGYLVFVTAIEGS